MIHVGLEPNPFWTLNFSLRLLHTLNQSLHRGRRVLFVLLTWNAHLPSLSDRYGA